MDVKLSATVYETFHGNTIQIVTPKRHFLTQNVFWRILRKNPFKGVGCSLIKEPKKN